MVSCCTGILLLGGRKLAVLTRCWEPGPCVLGHSSSVASMVIMRLILV